MIPCLYLQSLSKKAAFRRLARHLEAAVSAAVGEGAGDSGDAGQRPSPDALGQLSVPLLEKGLGTVETLVATHRRNRQRIWSLEADMTRANASRGQP